ADRFEELHRSVEERIAEARARIEEEKSILSVVLAELPEGVLVCTPEGRVILYNERARHLLESSGDVPAGRHKAQTGEFVGLGRSVFSAIDKPLIAYAMDEITAKLRRAGQDLTSSFTIASRSGRLLQVAVVPILSALREISGFVLILTDATEHMEGFRRADSLLQAYIIGVRRALANIRAAAELILGFPDLEPSKSNEFHRIIQREALAAGEATDRVEAEYAASTRPPGPLARMRARDFLDAVRRKAGDRLGVVLEMEPTEDLLWIRVDSYSMALALVFLLERIGTELGHSVARCRLEAKDRFVGMDFIWSGAPLRLEVLRRWELQPVSVAGEGLRSTLKDILARHRAELWSQACENPSEACVRILLEAAEPAAPVYPRRQTVLATARPVQPGQAPELDDRLLAELAYTVFDTETTGLDIREGDEMVAIGAVRIVNGRLLESENFEQLVKPECILRHDSIRIHGIQPEMLEGQPDVRQALHERFAEGTILVAHNAAFDMRLLQLQEKRTGIRFGNPVLDTMLLSAVLHPAQRKHDIESIAERLGITIMGRHTALGDAIAGGGLLEAAAPAGGDGDSDAQTGARGIAEDVLCEAEEGVSNHSEPAQGLLTMPKSKSEIRRPKFDTNPNTK
ncbi:MAG: exonuclease domain-containing protein, partial [Desulfobacterales bacterium]|nr:exonuclease domain-containing protein [Desulfobacterales bacterium]